MTNRLVITDDASERIVVRDDEGMRFSLFHFNKIGGTSKVIVLNPVEACKVAEFIKENLDAVSTAV